MGQKTQFGVRAADGDCESSTDDDEEEVMTTLLHLTTTPINLDRLLGRQLDAFKAAGYDVVAASAPGEQSEELRRRGIPHYPITPFTSGVDPAADVRSAAQLREVLHAVDPDILHTHSTKPGLIGRVVGRWNRVPIIVNTVRELQADHSGGFARRAAAYGLERVAAAHSDAELVQNVEDLDTLASLGLPHGRLHVLGSGIDLKSFTPSRAGARAARCRRIQLGIELSTAVVGMVGPVVWEKGFGEFFEAVHVLRDQLPKDKVAFVVAGSRESGPDAVDSRTLERMADEFGVHFLDEQEDVASLLSMIDVLALPSHREESVRTGMEAAAMGIPVVASDIRGCRHIVDHGETGLLVRPRKSEHLALAIERLVRKPALRSQMGRAARAKAFDEFDERHVIETTLHVYQELLVRKGLSAPEEVIVLEQPWYLDSIDLVDRSEPVSAAESIDLTEVEFTISL